MKKLIILTLAILMLTGCTSVPTADEYRLGNIQSAYSLPFEICSNGKYTLRKVEYGPGLEVLIDMLTDSLFDPVEMSKEKQVVGSRPGLHL